MVKRLLYLGGFLVLFSGCKQQDLTPSWLRINSFELITNEASQGPNNTNGISDAWIYMDDQPLGVFELPCLVPVLDEGEHVFTIFAGIKDNGISDTRIRYPFYQSFKTTATLVKNDTLVMEPVISYKESAVVAYLEDFEDAGISLVRSASSDTDMVFIQKDVYPEIVKYGDKCGGVFLTSTDSSYAGRTAVGMDLPRGKDVYLEVDFRTDNDLKMGVIAGFSDGSINEHTPLVTMKGQESGSEIWKKIYINLKEDVSFEITATEYDVYFLSTLENNLGQGNIYVDNIKVVHF